MNFAISDGVKNLNFRLFNTSKLLLLSIIVCLIFSSHKLEYTEPVPHKYELYDWVKQQDLLLCLVTISNALPPFNNCLSFTKYASSSVSGAHSTSETC